MISADDQGRGEVDSHAAFQACAGDHCVALGSAELQTTCSVLDVPIWISPNSASELVDFLALSYCVLASAHVANLCACTEPAALCSKLLV